ncbi:MAG: MerR family transcriptional regulator [Desulfobulbaceae bacterium]|uniref:MerR family transcriptional regulator n=1 Tax=Candidatus Desulfatifera sulfidica TaxID=2841691 RepID=A0A8J6N8I0_9BACT|nr:MerR family transcriptional regulator [Candidatus Desulfatifera sulfidica]
MTGEIPDKRYFKIGEVAQLADVATHVLRYWESEFSGIRPKRAHSGQRLYRRADVKLVLTIKRLLHSEGYTISGARKFLAGDQKINEATQIEPLPEDCLQTIKNELQKLQSLLNTKG